MESTDLAHAGVYKQEKVIQGCFVYFGNHVADAAFGMGITSKIQRNVDKKRRVIQQSYITKKDISSSFFGKSVRADWFKQKKQIPSESNVHAVF